MSILHGRSVYDLPQDQQESTAAKTPPGSDDISIRVPRPLFQLPTPSANP
jgi:hypothetical protein